MVGWLTNEISKGGRVVLSTLGRAKCVMTLAAMFAASVSCVWNDSYLKNDNR